MIGYRSCFYRCVGRPGSKFIILAHCNYGWSNLCAKNRIHALLSIVSQATHSGREIFWLKTTQKLRSSNIHRLASQSRYGRCAVVVVYSAGFRTRHTGHVPRGLHKKGPPQKYTLKKILRLYVMLSVIICKLRDTYAFFYWNQSIK